MAARVWPVTRYHLVDAEGDDDRDQPAEGGYAVLPARPWTRPALSDLGAERQRGHTASLSLAALRQQHQRVIVAVAGRFVRYRSLTRIASAGSGVAVDDLL